MDDLFPHIEKQPIEDETVRRVRFPSQALSHSQSRLAVPHAIRTLERVQFDDRSYFLKHHRNDTRPELLEMEAFSSDIYHLLLGARAPRACVVENEDHNTVGLLVESISDFAPCDKPDSLSTEDCISGALIEILVAAYFMEEDDLHGSNLGRNAQGRFCKIDNDMSFWPLTIAYKGDRLTQFFATDAVFSDIKRFLSSSGATSFITQKFSSFFSSPDADGLKEFIFSLTPAQRERSKFPVTLRDIETFPFLQDSHPYYWPARWIKAFHQPAERRRFWEHPNVVTLKWLMFTMICLTPKDFFEHCALTHIKGEGLLSTATLHATSCKLNLRRQLICCEAFRDFVKSLANGEGGHLLQTLWRRFELFSKSNPEHFQFTREGFDVRFEELNTLIEQYEHELQFERRDVTIPYPI